MTSTDSLGTFNEFVYLELQESVQFAIKKYDKLDLGDGYILSVSKADYSKSKQKKLPAECQVDQFAVCILKNIFEATNADDRFIYIHLHVHDKHKYTFHAELVPTANC